MYIKNVARFVAILILVFGGAAAYLLRGGFSRLAIRTYPVRPAAFTNWKDALDHPGVISMGTFRTGVVHIWTPV
jgi:hypothetical protein